MRKWASPLGMTPTRFARHKREEWGSLGRGSAQVGRPLGVLLFEHGDLPLILRPAAPLAPRRTDHR